MKNKNFKEIKELKLKYNKIRGEIEIVKRDNIELHNAIQEQVNLRLDHKKAWRKAKKEFDPIRHDIPTLSKNGIFAENDQQKADLLMEHYA